MVTLILLTFIEQSIDCSKYTDCFNCSIYDSCKWEHSTCISYTESPSFLYWWEKFNKCDDDLSNDLMSTYCGVVTQPNLKSKIKSIQLPNIDNHYGLKNLHCPIILENSKKEQSITIKSNALVDTIRIDIILELEDKTNKYIQVTDDEFIGQYNNVKLMTFHIFTSQMFDSNPFQIEILQKKKKLSVTSYVAICSGILSLIICMIGSIFCTKKMIENARRRNVAQTTTTNQMNNIDIELKRELKRKIKNLLLNELKGFKYGINEEKNGKMCTICLDEFKSDDIVSATKCQHLFHFKCISKWLNENITNLKCPNCNTNFILNLEPRSSTSSTNNNVAVRIYSSSRELIRQNNSDIQNREVN